MSVYVTIGNSDDKLTQEQWSKFCADVRAELMCAGAKFHGQWYSESASQWQNACFCVEVVPGVVDELKANLGALAKAHRQDSIAWADAPDVEFLSGVA
jgi:hypothetical protein